MHVLIALHDFPAGGTERVALHLARLWLGMGARVTFLAGRAAGAQRDRVPAGAAVVELDPPLPRSPLSRLRLGPAMVPHLAAIAPDVVMLPGNFHFVLARAFRAAFPALPIVAKLSNPPLAGVPRALHGPAGAAFRALTAPLTRLVAMTPGLAAEAAPLIGAEGVSVIPDPLGLVPGADFVRAPDPAGLRLLWAGRLEPQKNVGLALATVAELARGGDVTLDLVGDGAGRAAAERDAARLGIAAHVRFHGQVPSIAPWLAIAHALLLTSRYEGQPAVVAEALAHDVPVVATPCAHELTALLAEPMRGRLVGDPTPANLAAAARATAAQRVPPRGRIATIVADRLPERSAAAWLALFQTLAR